MEYYSVIKRNRLLIYATWMILEIILLNERSQTKMSMYYMIPFTKNFRNYKLVYSNSKISGCLGIGGQAWRSRKQGV